MDILLFIFLLLSSFQASFCSSITLDTLSQGSSLSAENPEDVLVSTNRVFSAGFHPVGKNAFCFAIWFTEDFSVNKTLVWMANRDQPVNKRGTKILLMKNSNLVLLDAGRVSLWSTKTYSSSPTKLLLNNNGNLVLGTLESVVLWESFKSPTDTLLPQQTFINEVNLVSSKSQTNYSSGYYKLYFDYYNVLCLRFQGPDPQISSVYWPYPWLDMFANDRSPYNNSKVAVLDSLGYFLSSDELEFSASDYGAKLHRRLTLDPDGNLRLYSLNKKNKLWSVTWQAFPQSCKIHGICGSNSFCTISHDFKRRCSCLRGFKMTKDFDWFYGCKPKSYFNLSEESGFVRAANTEFYGYDMDYFPNTTLHRCKEICLSHSECRGFQYKYILDTDVFDCFPKAILLNGYRTEFPGDLYLRVPKASLSLYEEPLKEETKLDCLPLKHSSKLLDRSYEKPHENESLKDLLWFAVGLGSLEFIVVSLVFCSLFLNRKRNDAATKGYTLAATRFQEFRYAELKKATRGFRDELGRGAGGIVYKGELSGNRVAAVKKLNEANQKEGEFLAEISTIGRLNHMNLIEMWGYCAEGKHRLLVYEYLEHGSLADNLSSNALDWGKRFAIAVGAAKGLAYLHEECLEWVLHCDVKPQNILLNSNYQPKVADFGLSKLLNRGETHNSNFSRIRGTRGYMAPEWVYNLPITSKVDVYSYGIVVLELITGKNPTELQMIEGSGTLEQGRLVTWVREKMNGPAKTIEEIVDPMIAEECDKDELELLLKVALQCVEEDKEARPSMRQVVETLQ